MSNRQLRLAEHGATVGLPPDPSQTVRFAADQLSYYLAVITGGRFPVEGRTGDIRLAIDRRLSEGAYSIRVDPPSARIAGADQLALLHGVYHFLEQKCGCRWLSTFEGGEVIPRNTELSVHPCTEIHRPVFTHRAFTNFPDIDERTVDMIDWMCKNRFNRFTVFANVAGSFERYRQLLRDQLSLRAMKAGLGHHSFDYWLPADEFFADHPEWYSKVGGTRTPDAQLCTSNPEVVETVAARINEFLADNPEIDLVGLWPNDGYGWCECGDCLAMERQRPSALRPSHPARTDTYISFVNRVAKLVAEDHPDRRLSALAYVNYVEPPHVPIADNVDICFAAMNRCFKHPFQGAPDCIKDNARYAEYFREWRPLVAGKLYVFCYLMLIDMCSIPYRITHMLPANFRGLADHGCDGFLMEYKPEEWATFGVNAHLIGQLSWDINCDIDAWLADYYQCLYGPAAADMADFWQGLRRTFVETGPCVYHYDLGYCARAGRRALQLPLAHLGRARVSVADAPRVNRTAVEAASMAMQLLLRMGHWQRRYSEAQQAEGRRREVLLEDAKRRGDELLRWAQNLPENNAIWAPRIETAVTARLQASSEE